MKMMKHGCAADAYNDDDDEEEEADGEEDGEDDNEEEDFDAEVADNIYRTTSCQISIISSHRQTFDTLTCWILTCQTAKPEGTSPREQQVDFAARAAAAGDLILIATPPPLIS